MWVGVSSGNGDATLTMDAGDEQSDEQARAGAEAGSRLLEYITRGANGALGEESKSKLPLFMRVNGAHQGAHHPGSTLSNDGIPCL